MAKVIINDEEFETTEGDLLINVARQHGAHIGFACNGHGVCTTCECKVLEGAELLSPYSSVEDTWLPASRKEQGYRLACQATIETDGKPKTELKVISRVEILKRQLLGPLGIGEKYVATDKPSGFLGFAFQTFVDHVICAPAGVTSSIKRLGFYTFFFPWGPMSSFIKDTGKVFSKQLGTTQPTPPESGE